MRKRATEQAQEKTRRRVIERFQETDQIPTDANYTDAVAIIGAEAHASALENMMDRPEKAVKAGKFGLQLAGMGDLVAPRVGGIHADTVNIQVNVMGEVADADWQGD